MDREMIRLALAIVAKTLFNADVEPVAILGSVARGKQGTDSGNPAKSAGYPYQSPVCSVGDAASSLE